MKHIRILCPLLIVSMISLTGCMDVKDISEEKSDLVAEYAAGVLLRYSDQYEHRLITREQVKKREAEDTAEPPVQSPDAASAVPSPEASGEDPVPEVPEVSLDELYQLKGIQVSFDSCKFTKSYGSSQISAEEGETLFIVIFSLKNISDAGKQVNLMKRDGIQYVLDVDGEQFNPGISMLANGGMNNLETRIGKGKTEKAALIFRMDEKKASASSVTLSIEEGNKKTSVKLK